MSLSISEPLRPMMIPGREVWMMIFSLLAARSTSICETPEPAKRSFNSFLSLRSSCSNGAPRRIASGDVRTHGSTSYSTRMRPSASSATCRLTAATAAMACPLYKTLLVARIFPRMYFNGVAPSPRSTIRSPASGRSRAVRTALTPGSASALLASIETMRAWAWGLRSTAP